MIETIDLLAVEAGGGGTDGVVWSTSPGGFHANLVVLGPGGSVGAHRNHDVDVLVVVLAGRARLDVDGERIALAAGAAAVVPKGAQRSVHAVPDGGPLRYLSVHATRGPLTIGPLGRRFVENGPV